MTSGIYIMPKMYFSFQKFKKNPHACTFHQFLRKNIDIFGALEVHFCVKSNQDSPPTSAGSHIFN